jgi:DNA replication protein DnaC
VESPEYPTQLSAPETEAGLEAEGHGVDSLAYALEICEHCGGSGYVSVEDGGRFPRQDICSCVLETRRRHAVEVRLQHLFGDGSRQMTMQAYQPGNSLKNRDAYGGCLAYVEHFPAFQASGVGFALQGPYGCGKTHLATATLIALVKRWPSRQGTLLAPYATSIPELLRLTRKGMKTAEMEDVIEKAMTSDICLLDDIGAEYHRESGEGMSWVDEQLYLILDYRLGENLPTIYTTNLRRSELARLLDARIVRRLHTKTATTWQLEGVEGTANPPAHLQALLQNAMKKKEGA